MSRKEEYWTLIQTLNETPAALDGAVDRARARARRSRAGRRFGIPLASLAGVAAAFAVLVNVSTPFGDGAVGQFVQLIALEVEHPLPQIAPELHLEVGHQLQRRQRRLVHLRREHLPEAAQVQLQPVGEVQLPALEQSLGAGGQRGGTVLPLGLAVQRHRPGRRGVDGVGLLHVNPLPLRAQHGVEHREAPVQPGDDFLPVGKMGLRIIQSLCILI